MKKIIFFLTLVVFVISANAQANSKEMLIKKLEETKAKLNRHLSTWPEDFRKSIDFKDGIIYSLTDRYVMYAPLANLEGGIIEKQNHRVILNCKNGGGCFYDPILKRYEDYSQFVKNYSDYDYQTLSNLMNNFLAACIAYEKEFASNNNNALIQKLNNKELIVDNPEIVTKIIKLRSEPSANQNEVISKKNSENDGNVIKKVKPIKTTGEAPKLNTKNLPYEWVIEPKYDGVEDFKNGYATVKIANNEGIIDTKGKVIIPIKYDIKGDYASGLVPIGLGYEQYNYVNSSGNRLNENIYKSAYRFSEGIASVQKDGEHLWIDSTGNIIKSFGRFSSFTYYSVLSEGMAIVSQEGVKGFVNKQGEEVIPKQYEDAGDFKEGLAPVKQNGNWGYIDKTSNWIIQPKYTQATSFSNGYASVRDGNKLYGLIDKKGNLVMSHFSTSGLFVSNNVVKTELSNKKHVFLNFDGSRFVDYEFDYAPLFSEDKASVELNGKFCVINNTGKIILETDLFYLGSFHNGLAIARETKGGKFGYIKIKDVKAANQYVKKDAKSNGANKEKVDLNALAKNNKQNQPSVDIGKKINEQVYGKQVTKEEEAQRKAERSAENSRYNIVEAANNLKHELKNLYAGLNETQLVQMRLPDAIEKTKKLESAFNNCTGLTAAAKETVQKEINLMNQLYAEIAKAIRINGRLDGDDVAQIIKQINSTTEYLDKLMDIFKANQ